MSATRETRGSIRADYPEPLWIQARDLINADIARGALRPGMRIPPERQLCQELRISRVTLRKALTQLVADGVLSASHGRGWYVSMVPTSKEWPSSLESFSETAARMGLSATARVLQASVSAATLDLADVLSIAPGTPLFVLERVRLLDALPIAIDLTHIPVALAPGLQDADFRTASLYEQLAEAGLEFSGANSTIEARPADEHVARHLELDVGRPILALSQIVVDAADRPVFASTIQYRGDRYRLRTYFSRPGPVPRTRLGRTSA
jgi:GntR family transcriptional regulator